jgi:hypothetical protein
MMMKIKSIVLGTAALCSLSSVTSAEYLEEMQQGGAAHLGYGFASVLWDQGKYTCASQDDVFFNFWPAVLRVVYDQCSTKYKYWADDAAMCHNGAETFVSDKADACMVSEEDCDLLGDTAAMEVSAVFCFPQTINRNKKHFFSRGCRLAAKAFCQDLVGGYVQELIDNNQCEDKVFGYDEEMMLGENCISVVDRLSETAAWPTDPAPSGSDEPPVQNEEDPVEEHPAEDPHYGGSGGNGGDNDGVVGGTWGGDNPQYGQDPYNKPSYTEGKKDPKLYVFTP